MTQKGDATRFTGDVWLDFLAPPAAQVSAGLVRFTPRARTAWHSHAQGQTLYVTDGVAIVHVEGEDPVSVAAGTSHFTPAGVRHWHGASCDRFMAHIAIAALPASPEMESISWEEPVEDDAYDAAVARAIPSSPDAGSR